MSTFTNKATLTFRGVTASSNTVVGEILGALTARKTALEESYTAGSRITYIISLLNSSEAAITGASVSDDLGGTSAPLDYVVGSAVLFIDGVNQDSLTVDTSDGLLFTGITVPANGNSMIVYETEANGSAPLAAGSSITNTALVTAGASTTEAQATVNVENAPSLSIAKALSPLTVTGSGSVTYTFTIENSGNMPAEFEDSVILSDTFDPALTNLTASLNGTPLVAVTDYTYTPATGEFATVPGVITVPAATFTTQPDGSIAVTPGMAQLTVTGNISA